MNNILYKEESFKVIGACMEVHCLMGCGFLEKVYHEALFMELRARGIPVEQEVLYDLEYKGKKLDVRYRADFVCFDRIILEIKAVDCLHPKHESQVLNYLAASGLKLGLLVNFGEDSLKYKRLVV